MSVFYVCSFISAQVEKEIPVQQQFFENFLKGLSDILSFENAYDSFRQQMVIRTANVLASQGLEQLVEFIIIQLSGNKLTNLDKAELLGFADNFFEACSGGLDQ